MESIQKSKPFGVKHKQEISFSPKVEEISRSIENLEYSNDEVLEKLNKRKDNRNRQSHDESEFRNSIKSKELFNNTDSNKFDSTRK